MMLSTLRRNNFYGRYSPKLSNEFSKVLIRCHLINPCLCTPAEFVDARNLCVHGRVTEDSKPPQRMRDFLNAYHLDNKVLQELLLDFEYHTGKYIVFLLPHVHFVYHRLKSRMVRRVPRMSYRQLHWNKMMCDACTCFGPHHPIVQDWEWNFERVEKAFHSITRH